MPRQELANDVLLFNNYFERIADVRSPGGINQVNGNLMKMLPENVVIEKMVRGQYGAQKRTFGYYIIISFKPVMIGGSLKYAAILLFSHDEHKPVDDLYKKILSYQNND
jgi:hypothetical protein